MKTKLDLIQGVYNINQQKMDIKKRGGYKFLYRNPFKSLEDHSVAKAKNTASICDEKNPNGEIEVYIQNSNKPTRATPKTHMRYAKSMSQTHEQASTKTNGIDEYFDTALLFLCTSHRDLELSPKVYIGVDNKEPTKFLSNYLTRSTIKHKDYQKPMFSHMLGLMIAKAEHDANKANYLPVTSAQGIPMAGRIDHATNFGYDRQFPSKANMADNIFKYKKDFDAKEIDMKKRYSSYKVTIDGNCIECFQTQKGKEDEYMLFMRGVCDFVEMPDAIINKLFDNFLMHAKQGNIKIDVEEIEKKRQARLELRDTAKEYFKDEIFKFKYWLKQEKYSDKEILKDIDWSSYLTFSPVQRTQSTNNPFADLLTTYTHPPKGKKKGGNISKKPVVWGNQGKGIKDSTKGGEYFQDLVSAREKCTQSLTII